MKDSIEDSPLRKPGSAQGWVLIAGGWLPVMVVAVIAPILPKMNLAFQGTKHADLLIPLMATLPGLFIALLATPIGILADNIGRKGLLLFAVIVYGCFGMAPFWLHSLFWIVASRAAVGVCEAIVIVTSTALISDYFSGDRREHWLAMQSGSQTVIGLFLAILGGVLGERSWRLPFTAYSFSFLLIPLVWYLLWEPNRKQTSGLKTPADRVRPGAEKAGPHWPELAGICLVTVFAVSAFFVVVVQLSYVLTERGFSSPRLIGIAGAIAGLAAPLGVGMFRWIRASYPFKLALSLGLSAAGFAAMVLAHGYAFTVAGAALNEVGSGLVLPTLLSWALAELPFSVRGRGTGAWQSSFFFGQFISPLVILGLAKFTGSLDHAILAYAYACALAACIVAIVLISTKNRSTSPNRLAEV